MTQQQHALIANDDTDGLTLPSQSPYLSADRQVMTLKSRQPPHTTRCTDLNPSRALSCSTTPSSAFCIAARLALSLSALHFIRHSRATLSKLTPSVIVGIVRCKIARMWAAVTSFCETTRGRAHVRVIAEVTLRLFLLSGTCTS